MRRFRLISRDDAYDPLIYGEVYSGDVKPHGWEEDVLWNAKFNAEDWEEVFEETLLHQTDLGYYAGLAIQGLLSDPEFPINDVSNMSLSIAKELIKQLKEECQG